MLDWDALANNRSDLFETLKNFIYIVDITALFIFTLKYSTLIDLLLIVNDNNSTLTKYAERSEVV